jgi:hypothetical protein
MRNRKDRRGRRRSRREEKREEEEQGNDYKEKEINKANLEE